jgi:hypothetical protein
VAAAKHRFGCYVRTLLRMKRQMLIARRIADIDSTACEVEFPKGIYLQTVTLNNMEIWTGDVKESDSAPDSNVTF